MKIKRLKRIRSYVCKGCMSFEEMNEHHLCKIPHKKDGKQCPCSICLIKSVCNKSCEILQTYSPRSFVEIFSKEQFDVNNKDYWLAHNKHDPNPFKNLS